MKVKLSDGKRLFVDVEGTRLVIDGHRMLERPVVILLHGGQVDYSWFRPGFARLTQVAQLVYVDRRGGGRSDRGSPDWWGTSQ